MAKKIELNARPVKYETVHGPDGVQTRVLYSDSTAIYRKASKDPHRIVLPNGSQFIRDPIIVNGVDSGQVSAFRPAEYVKPQSLGVMRRAQAAWSAFKGINPYFTTEQGAAGAASPVTYYLTLWEQRFGRRALIEDTNTLFRSDPRIWRSVNMFAEEACRGGMTIQVFGDGAIATRAKKLAKRIERLFGVNLITGWGKGLLIDGDLFVQMILDEEERLVDVQRMPTIGMERLTNDADQFINPLRAFEQIDAMTFETVAPFEEALMSHCRWKHIDGDRYGISELMSIRRNFRLLELLEQSQAIRRMVRAALSRLHTIGDKDNPGSEQQLINYKNKNGFVEGQQEVFDPMNAGRDYFAINGIDIKNLDGDQNIDEIEDLLHFQNVLQAGLPTPGIFYGLDAGKVNRDVVEDMRELWLKSTSVLNQSLEQVIRHGFELALLCEGFDPDSIEYSINWSVSSLEQPTQRVTWVLDMQEGGLISRKTALLKLNDLVNVHDIEKEVKDAEAETRKDLELKAEFGVSPDDGKPDKRGDAIAANTKTNGKMKQTVLPSKN